MSIIWPKPAGIHTIVFDFDGVFTNNKVMLNSEGQEWVQCDRADGLAIDLLRLYQHRSLTSLNAFILSTERNSVVLARAKKLQLECKHGESDKLAYMRTYFKQTYPDNLTPWTGLIYLGNDLNDLAVMEMAGFSVAPQDAHSMVKSTADVVLPQQGGDGFVRAFVEAFLNIGQLTVGEINELISNR